MNVDIFLDRDGTLIQDVGYISSPADLKVLPGVIEGLQLFKECEYRLHVVSNQSGLARGKFTAEQFNEVESRFLEVFRTNGVTFDTLNYCFHHPSDACDCRKPKTGLFEFVDSKFHVDKRTSGMIGDSDVDREAASAFRIAYWNIGAVSEEPARREAFKIISNLIVEYFNEVQRELE